jgi:hypothetical protein
VCAEARDIFAAAPAPADADSEAAFIAASDRAVGVVRDALDDLFDEMDDPNAAALSWQVNNFPSMTNSDEVLAVAQRASAAIIRIDRFAAALGMPGCGAATWRPADWRTIAGRHKKDQTEAQFRGDLNRICAGSFPNPALLEGGRPLLEALAATDASGDTGGADEIKERLLSRLSNLSNRPSATGRFMRDFPRRLPELSPPDTLEREHTSLIAAFMDVESVLPNVIPQNPSQEFRSHTDPAFDELEEAWGALEITC